ncbi:MAG: phage holin family protein [Taibaiella sp.]|nr:phage holin family protein [Taibaiella sp.]
MNVIKEIKEKIARYLQVHLRLLQLDIVERVSSILGNFAFLLVILFCGFAMLLFVGFALSEYFTDLLNSRVAGRFLTVGVYLVLMIVCIACKRSVINFFSSIFVRSITDDVIKNTGEGDNYDEDKEFPR